MATKQSYLTKVQHPQAQEGVTAADLQLLPLLRNRDAEKVVVDYCLNRIRLANEERSARADYCKAIDLQLFSQPEGKDDDEKKMLADLKEGKSVRPVDRNFGFGVSQLDEAETYMMTLYAPEMDIFTSLSTAELQVMGNALAGEINKQGKHAGHYRNLDLFVKNALRYNFGALGCFWEQHQGIVFKGTNGEVTKQLGTVWEGNYLQSFDAYNFFYDTSHSPVDLPKRGEFFGWVKPISGFTALREAQQGKIAGVGRFVNTTGVTYTLVNEFYIKPPELKECPSKTDKTDFVSDLSGGAISSAKNSVPGLERVHFIGWIDPALFGNYIPAKSKAGILELWRFDIVNSKFLTLAQKLENTHGMLPVVISTPAEDSTGSGQQSPAESLIPMQQFCSFLLNSHQTATRKALGGITLFDPTRVPLGELPIGDLIGAKIPVNPGVSGQGVDSGLKQISDVPETIGNLQQIGNILELMQKILPTDMLKQVTDLQRATRFQAAAVVMSSNKRNLKMARVIYDQALTTLALMLVYNVYANLLQIEYRDPATKQITQMPVANLVNSKLEYDIGTGIRGLDRLTILENIKEILNYAIQSSQANQRIDIVKLLDYATSLTGDKTDFNAFELTQAQQQQIAAASQPPQPAAPAGA